jgi:hypothetical protein
MTGGFDQQAAGMAVAGLGDPALRERVAPEEFSVGTNPRYAPIERPLRRCQSPISTANPNAINVEIPRRHPNRVTTGVNTESAAISTIASSRRSRRSTADTMASNAAS